MQGYSLGPALLDFHITVNVTTTTPAASQAGSTTETLTLSPSLASGLSSGSAVYAQLLGDLASYQSMPSLEYSYLMIPQWPGEQCGLSGFILLSRVKLAAIVTSNM